jgi:hypothetical protein
MAAQIGRLDVVGGTAAGWSALVTTIAATRLAAAGDVTVLDLTDGGQAAAGILAHAPDWRIIPLTWTLPGDLPSLNLGVDLGSDALADVLALTAAAARPGESDQAADAALLGGVLQALGPAASMAQLMAALRVLAQTGDPRRQLSGSDLSAAQLKELAVMAGRGTEQLVANRAWLLEARLRVLGRLGRPPASPLPARLRVAWTDRTAAPTESRVLGCYLTAACAAALQQLPPAEPWQQTVCLLGADRLSADVLDRITAAAETAGAGLVLGFQSIPPVVRARLGRGNAAVAVMRLGNAQDARVAAEQIGTEHRFVVSQLTDTVGTSSTDTSSDTYTGTWGVTTSVADSVSVSSTIGSSSAQGRSRHGRFSPFPEVSESANRDTSMSAAASETLSLSAATTASHSFGSTGARAAGASRSLAGTVNRSRELLVEQHELQYLPETTLLLCKPGAEGREVVLADANPTILRLSSATMVCPVAEPAAGP